MADRLRWGILGTGNIARQFAVGVNASKHGVLTAVASRDGAKAAAFAAANGVAANGVAASLGDYRGLLRRDDVDAVYVSLPNSMHHDWTIAALEAGKHVLCEKPFAVTTAEARAMFAAADAHRRVLMEAFMYRCHPQTLAVQRAVADGVIGRVTQVRASFCYRTSKIAGNVRFDPALAGGALMDVGCYCISLGHLFCGPATDGSATGNLHPTGVDDLCTGWLKYAGGAVASFTCGTGTQANNTAYICGTDGFIEIPVPWKPPVPAGEFVIAHATPPKQDFAGGGAPPPPPRRVVTVPFEGDLYGIEADDFASSVWTGGSPRVTRAETMEVCRWIERFRAQIGLAY
ncbi:Gfo/Idh/MocA family protein [Humisphaera borealis]|uniref:Gfo/Idh/MocA family oxidoreductase n=1 Tax=Humisphaera borealis TaxID=2807512 RepID=A0A7M2X4F5_9BACT|nr:Gfo/Idh/MocA family oxidoreductase [Humisphaera borealis]QOV91650.1 Gfo/Idh/MocA family oxidoreductase [Humisphaera borealis]